MDKEFYIEVKPVEIFKYLTEELTDVFHHQITEEIAAKPKADKLKGQGVFFFKDISRFNKVKGPLQVAARVQWTNHAADLSLATMHVVHYYLYSEKVPDILLDNMLDAMKDQDWETYIE
jgi:hypothetical protein